MFFLYVLVSCISFTFVSEGTTVKGIIGRHVSLSWTYNNTNNNYIRISRNSSYFLLVWPITNFVALHEKDERLQVYVYNATLETVTITVSISNVTEKDAGIYKLELSGDSEDLNDSVTLQIDETTQPWITMVRHARFNSYIELQCNSLNISTGKSVWRLNGSMIESNGRYSQNNTILSIHNLTADDMYNIYKCNPFGGEFESDPYRLNICPLGPLLGVALVIVAISMIIVGILILVTQRRKHPFSRSAFGTEHQSDAGSSNRDVPRELLRSENHDRSLTFPIVQNNACRRIGRSGYPVVNRISRSSRTLMNHTQYFWNPLRQAFYLQTLQTLTQLSYAIRSQHQSDDSINATCCSNKDRMSGMERSAKGISLDELYSVAQSDSRVRHDELNNGARSVSLNNFRPLSVEQLSQEDQYSTIDEAILSVYHCVNANEDDETLQKGCSSPEAGNNDYDSVILSTL